MQIIPLNEGVYTIDKTKIFVPFNLEKDQLQQRPVGSILVEVQPFLIITKNDVLLLDTGLGFAEKGELIIHNNMLKHGIEPSHITKVLLSHLHKDHAGGISKRNNLGHYQSAFPNAVYYVQHEELEFAFEKGFPSYMPDELDVLQGNSQVVQLNGNGSIDNYIHYEITGAHSMHHQTYRIVEDGQTIFFGGDDAPQLQQMKNRFVAKYDYDGRKAMELRQQWWEQGKNEKWTFLFYHDIKQPVFTF